MKVQGANGIVFEVADTVATGLISSGVVSGVEDEKKTSKTTTK